MNKDDIIRMAKEAGLFTHKEVQPEILAFYNLAAAAEREACAKLFEPAICEAHRVYAKAIRARGNT